MVIIDGVDRTPYCGTHLPTLSMLQVFLFPSPTSSPTSFRHYFLAGPRLLNHLSTVQSLLTRTSGILSCGPLETPERVALVVEESKRREKCVEDLERELAGVLSRQLADEMARWRAAGGGEGESKGEWDRYVSRTDDSLTARTLGFAFGCSMVQPPFPSPTCPPGHRQRATYVHRQEQFYDILCCTSTHTLPQTNSGESHCMVVVVAWCLCCNLVDEG